MYEMSCVSMTFQIYARTLYAYLECLHYKRHLLMHLCLKGYYHSDRYLLKTSAWKKQSSPSLVTQLSNTLEHGLPSLPKSKGKILMS